jgi:hypothetical protein
VKRDFLLGVVGLAIEGLAHHLLELAMVAAAVGAASVIRALGFFQG